MGAMVIPKKRLNKGYFNIYKNGTVALRQETSTAVGIEGEATLLVDEDSGRIGLTKPRAGEAGRRVCQVRKSGRPLGLLTVYVGPALKLLGCAGIRIVRQPFTIEDVDGRAVLWGKVTTT